MVNCADEWNETASATSWYALLQLMNRPGFTTGLLRSSIYDQHCKALHQHQDRDYEVPTWQVFDSNLKKTLCKSYTQKNVKNVKSWHICKRWITRNSSGNEIANVNFLYDDIVHALGLQNTIDSCINSATDRRGYVLERRFTKFSEITQCNGHYAV